MCRFLVCSIQKKVSVDNNPVFFFFLFLYVVFCYALRKLNNKWKQRLKHWFFFFFLYVLLFFMVCYTYIYTYIEFNRALLEQYNFILVVKFCSTKNMNSILIHNFFCALYDTFHTIKIILSWTVWTVFQFLNWSYANFKFFLVFFYVNVYINQHCRWWFCQQKFKKLF